MKPRLSKRWLRYWEKKCDGISAKWQRINAEAKRLGLEQHEYCDRFPEKCR